MKPRTAVRLIIALVLLLIAGGLPFYFVGAAARPACTDAPKAGVVELDPAGTANAIVFVEFDPPFCNGPVVVVATVNNHNTAGERTAAQVFGLEAAAISIQLDAPSEDTYHAYWLATRATQ